MNGIAEVQARISQIQTRIDMLAARPAPRAASASTDPSFAAALTAAQDETTSPLGTGRVQSAPPISSASRTPGSAAAVTSDPGRGSDVSGSRVVAEAKKYLGVPYVWGGESLKEGGFDCSGLVQTVYKSLGIDLPRTASPQAKEGRAISSLADAKPGDLVFFSGNGKGYFGHVGIYAGNGMMVAAPKRGDVVKLQKVYETPDAIRRILPDSPTPSAVATTKASSTAAASATTGSGPWAKYRTMFEQAAIKHGVPAKLLGAVATVENASGNPTAKSPAGAVGVMQFMPKTAQRFGVDRTDPASSIDGAARYLKILLAEFKSIDKAVAAYNAGEGNVKKYGGIPPFEETQNYVVKVRKALEALR